MRIFIKATFAVVVIVFAAAASGHAQYKELPVVKDGLINELRRPGFKPSEMVMFIRSHGVDFVVTPELEAQLVSSGATPAIIKAAKENYRLPGGKRASFLNVEANVADAEFVVDGVGGAFNGKISDHPLAPGSYRVTAKRVGYLSETQTAQLREPGKRISVSFTLKPAPLNTLLDTAKAALERNDLKTVEDLCRLVLAREPANASANMLLGRSFYIKGDFTQAADHVIKGLQGGDSISFVVLRRKQGRSSAGESLEIGSLVLKPLKIALVGQNGGGSPNTGGETEFEIPYSKVLSVQSDKKDADWKVSMKASIPKNSGKDEKRDLNFYMPRSRVEVPQGQAAGTSSIICSDCQSESKFIADVISRMKKEGVTTPKSK